jgi:hypothetical protein
MRRSALLAAAVAVAATVLAAPLSAGSSFPGKISLPNGFRPEGIAIEGKTFYVGSIPTGAVYRGDLRTGQGAVFVPGTTDGTRAAIGMKVDRRDRLFVAGGPTGKAFVYDADTGAEIKTYQLTTVTPTFVNDVIVTRTGAFFTDSVNQVMYRVPIGRGGALGDTAVTIPLTGDIVYDPMELDANGIEATPNGKKLIIVQSGLGKLFTVDPETGVTDEIALSEPVTFGDGLLLDGKTLYVVRNRQNRIAVVRLDRRLTSGQVVAHIRDTDFDVPTTVAEFGSKLYAVNARFSTEPAADTPYWVAQVDKVSGKHEDDEDDDD